MSSREWARALPIINPEPQVNPFAKGPLSWCGGPLGLTTILGAQVALVALLIFDWRLPFLIIAGVGIALATLRVPVLAVCLLVVARLVDTASHALLRIGSLNIGAFEIVLLLAICATLAHLIQRQETVRFSWPWQMPLLFFLAWQILSLAWCTDLGEGVQEVISVGVIVANSIIITTFVRTPRDFKAVLWAWVAACIAIGSTALIGAFVGWDFGGAQFEAASGGGRATGLGQQPNWYAMNLMFIVHTAFGFALIQKRALLRWLLVGAGVFIFFNLMRSGSRGGAYAIVIGGSIVALADPLFRKWFWRLLLGASLIAVVAAATDVGATSRAVQRILSNIGFSTGPFRTRNWIVCLEMAIDTWGRGIGPGGYIMMLEKYDWYLFTSLYRYPHSILLGILAHYGVIGVGLFGWLLALVFRMGRELVTLTRGTELGIFAWTMPAAMIGYGMWSFVEFEFNDKPFWEFLALYTALYLIAKRANERGEVLEPLRGAVPLPWQRRDDRIDDPDRLRGMGPR